MPANGKIMPKIRNHARALHTRALTTLINAQLRNPAAHPAEVVTRHLMHGAPLHTLHTLSTLLQTLASGQFPPFIGG